MNGFIITGIVFSGLGSLLIIYGTFKVSEVSSNSSKEEIINQFNERIDGLALISDPEDRTKKAIELQSEYTEWAENFELSKSELKIKIQKDSLDKEQYNLELNKKYKPAFSLFFDHLTGLINAYNDKSETNNIGISKQPIPDNIVSFYTDFQYNIIFSDLSAWIIWISPKSSYNDRSCSSIHITRISNYSSEKFPYPISIPNLSIIFTLDTDMVLFSHTSKSNGFENLQLNDFKFKDYKTELKKTIENLLQYELLHMSR
jgi:hypothetical protein